MINVAVVPTLNNLEQLRSTLRDLFAQDIQNVTALVVNNGSDDGTRDFLDALRNADYPVVAYNLDANAGVAAAWNMGLAFQASHGVQNLFFVNDDVKLRPDTFSALARCPGVLISATNVQTEERLWKDPIGSLEEGPHGGPDFSCFFLRTSTLGEFDPAYWPGYFEDNDYDHRALARWGENRRQFVYSACVPYIHHGSGTLKSPHNAALAERLKTVYFPRNREYYIAKWGGPPGLERHMTPFGR